MLKNRQFFYILTLICLAGFLILPNISLADNFDDINLREMGKYLELPARKVENLLHSLINLFYSEWIDLMASGYSTSEERAVPSIMKKVVQVQALNHLLIDAPIQTVWMIIENTTKIARVFLTKDPSVILNELEKESVKKAVGYGMSVLLEKEIRISPGAIDFEYISQKGEKKIAFFQYIVVYQPFDSEKGEVLIRFYSPKPLEPPENRGSVGLVVGIYTDLTHDLPPFIVDIRGTVEDYKWVSKPSMKIDFPPEVPDLGIKPLSWWEKYILKPIESTIKDVEIIITKVTGKSLGLTDTWNKIKSIFSNLNPFQATVGPSPTSVPPDLPSEPQDEEQEEVINPAILEEIGKKIEEVEELGETGSSPAAESGSLSLEQVQEILDDIAEQIDILTQKLAELIEAKKQQTEEEIEEIEEVEEEEILDEDLDKKEKEDDICFKSININTASKEELQKITSVGPVMAQRIIEARPFSSIYDLLKVNGIGEKTLQKIIGQGCAYVEGDTGSGSTSGGGGGGASGQQTQPKITLSYSENNPANKEIEAILSLADFKNTLYDVKISIEKEGKVLSDIYNESKSEWQSSFNYLPEVFSSTSFSGDFKLKIKDAENSFRGEANIIVRVRESGKTKYSEFIGKINLTEPEPGDEGEEEETPILEVSPESLEFGPVEFEPRILTITNLSNETLEWTATSTTISQEEVDWLQISPFSGVIPSEEFSSSTVSVDISGLTEGIYLAKIIITVKGAEENSLSKEIEVTLNISQTGYPKIVLISEVQIADNEFVELYNFGEQDIDISNWYLSYFPAGRDWNNPHLNKSFSESSTSTISAKSYYLIGFGNYPSGGGNPEPDWKPYEAHLSDEAGAIGIFSCNPKIATSTSITLEQAIEQAKSSKIDLFGWEKKAKEELVVFETEPFIFDKEEIERKSFQRIKDAENNYIDTNNNQEDFEIKDPSPTNSKGETFSPPSPPSFGEPPWPMFQHDAQHTGRSPFAGPGDLENPDPQILIEGEADDDYFGTPVIGSDGTLYLTARITTGGETKEGLFAFSFNGNQKWVYEITNPFNKMPVLWQPSNTVYVAHSGGLLAINSENGNVKWSKTGFSASLSQNLVVSENGMLYFVAGIPEQPSDWGLYAIDDEGQILWVCPINPPETDLTIGKQGNIYFGYGDTLFAISPDGTKKWEKTFEQGWSVKTPAIEDDGTIYVIGGGHYSEKLGGYIPCFNAIDPDNPQEEKWMACGAYFKGIPVISSLGNVYISRQWDSWGGEFKFEIRGFDSQGNGWLPKSYSGTIGQLIMDNKETIYALLGRGTVGAFDQSGELKWSANGLEGERTGPLSLGGDGSLFIPGAKKLYMIKPH